MYTHSETPWDVIFRNDFLLCFRCPAKVFTNYGYSLADGYGWNYNGVNFSWSLYRGYNTSVLRHDAGILDLPYYCMPCRFESKQSEALAGCFLHRHSFCFQAFGSTNFLSNVWWFRILRYFESNVPEGRLPKHFSWPIPYPKKWQEYRWDHLDGWTCSVITVLVIQSSLRWCNNCKHRKHRLN